MDDMRRYVTIGVITVVACGVIIGMVVAGAAYLQDREYKAAGSLVRESFNAGNETIQPITTATANQVQPQRPKPKHIGTIENEKGTFDIVQDASGKYHYIQKGTQQ